MRKPSGLVVLAVLVLGTAPACAGPKKPRKATATPVATVQATPDAGLGVGAPEAVQDILSRVEKAQASMKDVRMDLKMEVKDAYSGQKQSVRGEVRMKAPDKVFAHYVKPTEQFLYINGPDLLMYQPSQNTVFRQSSGKGQPAYLGVGKELKRYSKTSRVSVAKDDPERVVLLFVPDGGESQFERMRVTIRKDAWWPEKVEIQGPSMTTTAQFLKPVFDQGIPDGEFKFKIPEGVSVVEGEIF